jgi:hypothetical protein
MKTFLFLYQQKFFKAQQTRQQSEIRQRRMIGLNPNSNQFKSLEAEMQWACIRDR